MDKKNNYHQRITRTPTLDKSTSPYNIPSPHSSKSHFHTTCTQHLLSFQQVRFSSSPMIEDIITSSTL